jgi:AAHS family 4-hydroxybenzoate transporter-like MFS transporter
MVGGYLLNIGWSLGTVFAVAAVPALVAALTIFTKGRLQTPSPAHAVPVAATK